MQAGPQAEPPESRNYALPSDRRRIGAFRYCSWELSTPTVGRASNDKCLPAEAIINLHIALVTMKTTATALLFAGAAALNPLKARRSVAKYSDKAVPASATTKALEAAIQAPNHFLSEPWRF